MSFSSVSISQNTATRPSPVFSGFPLGPGDVFVPNGGNFLARNLPLVTYIMFAYKIMPNQEQSLLSQLPEWAMTDRFDIQAKADGNPTKDQMRLMMQSLLAERFKLIAHYESRQVPVIAVLVDQPGQFGPLLQRHPEDLPCPTTPYIPSPAPGAPPKSVDDRFPQSCGGIINMTPSEPGRVRVGARNVLVELIADSMTGGSTGIELPVIDKTELTGRFDFAIEFAPQTGKPAAANRRSETAGPTFEEALKEQLGLRLERQTGRMDFLVVDSIDQFLPN